MSDLAPPLPAVFLKPGEFFVSSEPHMVSTLLGSCVAVVMVSRKYLTGAICHGLLPTCRAKGNCSCADRFRFMDCAIRGIAAEMVHRGVPRGTIEAKIFGGADMFHGSEAVMGVGRQNIAMAIESVMKEKIRVVASDVGGMQGRKLFFFTHTGEVFLKRLSQVGGRHSGQVEVGAGRSRR